nr:phage/plasmid replication protein, II/X family [Escherichia coli]
MANQVINYLRNVSNGQTKKTKAQDYDTTVTWNGGSRHRTLVSYLKWNEMQAQITRLRRKKSCQLSQYEKNALHVLSIQIYRNLLLD